MPELDPTVEYIIKQLSGSRTQPYRIVQRAKIIDLLSQGKPILDIAKEVKLHRNRVSEWRARFIEALPEINETNERKGRKECEKLIITILSDKPRPGAPKKFSSEEEDSVVAVACLNPEELGEKWPISNWSHSTLSMYLTEEEIIRDISASTVGRILKNHNLKPHKRRMWLHSPDKLDDLDGFVDQVKEVSSLLKSCQDLYSEGVQVLSIDEKPGIQARSPIEKTVPASPGKPALQEMFYTRNGRTDLIQTLNVCTGELLEPYLNETHNEQDFVVALARAIEEQQLITPDDRIVIVCDNFSTHVSESVVRLIDATLGLKTSKKAMGRKGSSGILKNKQTRRAFLEDDRHQIYFVFTPKHASWLNPVECFFSIIERSLLKNGSFDSVEVLIEKIKAYADWYNEHSARPFDYQFHNFEEKIQNWQAAA